MEKLSIPLLIEFYDDDEKISALVESWYQRVNNLIEKIKSGKFEVSDTKELNELMIQDSTYTLRKSPYRTRT